MLHFAAVAEGGVTRVKQVPSLCSSEVSVSQLNDLRGISNTDRRDQGLYKDQSSQPKSKVLHPDPVQILASVWVSQLS